MNSREKMYFIDKCIRYYEYALDINKPYFERIVAHTRANMLKEIIEHFVDCQPKIYYDKYKMIVNYYNKMKSITCSK